MKIEKKGRTAWVQPR